MRCRTTVLGLLNPFQCHGPAAMWLTLPERSVPWTFLCLSEERETGFCKKEKHKPNKNPALASTEDCAYITVVT